MQMLYNSDSYVVVAFEVPAESGDGSQAAADAGSRGGYEIVDKLAGKEIFIQGAVAASFQQGVQALVAQADSQETALAAVDDYIAGYATLAQQPVRLH
ncbi:MAG: DUF3567 domain-containing protein [Burkholderiaceae bacterium]|nr:DUF3567 domain-containing protein [Burkholderiaceae bacterium]